MHTIADAVAPLGSGPLTEDALARHVRPLFARALKPGSIHLAHHTLARPLDRTADDVREALDAWYDNPSDPWARWRAEVDAFRARVARLIACSRPDAIVPKASAAQGLRAVLNAHATPGTPSVGKPIHVIATRAESDSTDAILKTYAARGRARITWIDPDEQGFIDAAKVAAAVTMTTDLVVASHVAPATGQVLTGIDAIAKAIHTVGGLLLLDCSHTAGAIPFDFGRSGADFAIGACAAYAHAGPGAAWLAIHPKHLIDEPRPVARRHALGTLDTGCFALHDAGTHTQGDEATLASGGDAWLEGPPAVLPFYQARAGLELVLAIGVERLGDYNRTQQGFLRDRLADAGVEVERADPASAGRYGAFLAIPTPNWRTAAESLRTRGVIADARPLPTTAEGDQARGCLRLAPDLLTTQDELARAASIVAEAIKA
ncbi:MAG: aminotransferase class V-fold PLP-dependent enzyme [Phycisphaerales bacterium]